MMEERVKGPLPKRTKTKSKPEEVKLIASIPTELKRRVAVEAVKRGRKIKEVVEEALREWLQRRRKGGS